MKRFLTLALVGLPMLLAARPTNPNVVDVVKNPDGTTLRVRSFGDEKFNFYTDADAVNILERDANGFWCPAVRNGRTLQFNEDDIDLLRSESLKMNVPLAEGIHRMAALDSEGRTTYPTVSTESIPALVILVEFPDSPFTVNDPVGTFTRMLNEEGFSDYNAKGSARDYFLASSNGLFNVHFDVAPIVKLKNHHAWYTGWDIEDGKPVKPSNYIRHRRMGDLIQEALEQLDPVVDFSKYDLDGNNEIDNIFFFYSGYGQADSKDETTIWPHQGSYRNHTLNFGYPDIIVDGVKMRTYACSNELNYVVPAGEKQPWLDGIGAFCHEYGHVLGLPDLYDTASDAALFNTKTPGHYSIMDTGSYNDNSTCPPLFSAYEKWLCRWLDYEDLPEDDITSIKSISIPSDGVQKAYRVRIKRPGSAAIARYYPEYYVFETRSNDSWDKSMPEEGVYIWRINYTNTKWVNNEVNYRGTSNVEMIYSSQANGSSKATYAFPGANDTRWAVPNSNPVTSTSLPIAKFWFTDFDFNPETKVGTVGYNLVSDYPTDVTTMQERISRNGDSDNSFYVHWDAVPGATGYMLTVFRTDSRGMSVVVNGLKDKIVGNVTSFLIENQSANTAMKQKFDVYVRVIRHCPSESVSNTFSFVPAEILPAVDSAVEGIYDDEASIIGGNGCIYAPANAEIFNLNGVRVGNDNLPAGVYVVRYGSKVSKVIVK
ncbi:MAG: M6 family metalloprotease domain-containing protein [Clostridium sp.]|nr:M6 family metalloprotease domain-containing protein [Prevotella sp.]MCM1378120.1 M6 family metalloprotease domain-containing protein [Prevotella sp.]MCM1428946.1 M6 family metalloprotease domain-containing protein [Clostridium sp.]MCM1475980.1 M6 family metalloprotease domain-containing protein [Muribaculaceae bacterium]